LKEGTISRAYRSTVAITTSRGMRCSRAWASAASTTRTSYTSRSMSTWRLVSLKGGISKGSRVFSSSITRFVRCRTSQRTLGTISLSSAAQAARIPRRMAAQRGRVMERVTGSA
jgi:hypothetical protein